MKSKKLIELFKEEEDFDLSDNPLAIDRLVTADMDIFDIDKGSSRLPGTFVVACEDLLTGDIFDLVVDASGNIIRGKADDDLDTDERSSELRSWQIKQLNKNVRLKRQIELEIKHRGKNLEEAEDFDLSDNPVPGFKFKIGEEVVNDEDYDYYKDRGVDWSDITSDIATIVAREKNLKYVRSKHDDINSKYNIDLVYDTDFEIANYDFDVNHFINQPWYLLEYPREEDFGEVRIEWVPEEDVRELDFLNEQEDFDLSDNPLVGVGKEYNTLIKDFIKDVISKVKDKEIYPKGLKKSEIPDEVYEELRFVQDNHEGEIPGLDALMANFSEGDILVRIKHLLKQAYLSEEEDFDLSDNPLHDSSSLANIVKDNDFRISFNTFVNIVDPDYGEVGWESFFSIKQPNGAEYAIVLQFDYRDNNDPAGNFKPFEAQLSIYSEERSLSKNEQTALLQNPKIISMIKNHRSRAKSEMKARAEKARLKGLKEDISRNEAITDIGSVQTVADGKRGVAYITISGNSEEDLEAMEKLIQDHGLKSMFVRSQSNPNEPYVIYAPGHEKEANELKDIAEKYNGYLYAKATEQDTRRIGQLLSYKPEEIEDFIEKNYRTDIKEFFNTEVEDFDLSDNPAPNVNYLTMSKLGPLEGVKYKGFELFLIDEEVVIWGNHAIDPTNKHFVYSKAMYLRAVLRTKGADRYTSGEGTDVSWHGWIGGKIGRLPDLFNAVTSAEEVSTKEQFLEYSKRVIDDLESRFERGEFDEYFYDDSMDLTGLSEEENNFDLSDNPIVPRVGIGGFYALRGQELNGWKIDVKLEDSKYSSRYDEMWPAELDVILTKELTDPDNEPRLKITINWELEGDEDNGEDYSLENYQPTVQYGLYVPRNLLNGRYPTGVYYSLVPESINKDIDTVSKLKTLAIEQIKVLEDEAQTKINDANNT